MSHYIGWETTACDQKSFFLIFLNFNGNGQKLYISDVFLIWNSLF